MAIRNGFLSVIMCVAMATVPSYAMQIRTNDCANPTYRKLNPNACKEYSEKSFSFATGGAIAGGTLAAIGAGLAILGSASGGTSNNATPQSTQSIVPMPTLPAYTHVGADVTSTQLAAVMDTTDYGRNFDQYNEIRMAYSLARGYTGKNSTIAILDTGYDEWHGKNVADIASGPIAPDATITSYKVINSAGKFLPFNEIASVIDSASDANIYNSSWVFTNKYADDIQSRSDLAKLTNYEFINSIERAATERDAIFVWAAGNNGASQSSAFSALPLISNKISGHFVNVVAWDDRTGQLADFSNACGVTKNFCITAPGTHLSAGFSSNLEGTSFAAPIVSAAIAVIREAFPYMPSTQITELLFTTARDLGVAGVDEIYGHGMLDLERATRPVGAELIPISENVTRPMETVRVSGTIAKQIKSANLEMAFVDGFGRAFKTPLNDKIKTKNRGLGFTRLRQDVKSKAQIGNFEFGVRTSDFLGADGFMATTDKTDITFIASHATYNTGALELFHRAEFGISNPHIDGESVVTNFSNIYTASVTVGATIGDWTLSVATNDAILSGQMDMRLATGRANNGALTFADYSIDLATRPSVEYSVGYKNITAAFVDNPYGTDEIYVIARGKISF